MSTPLPTSGDLVANPIVALGHDLNNLLTVIGGYAAMLMATVPPGEAAMWAAEIEASSNRAAAVVRELLVSIRPAEL